MRRRLAFVLAAGLLLAGCGDRRQQTPPDRTDPPAQGRFKAAPDDSELLRELLADRARALQRARASAYAATGAGPQRARDRIALRNRRGLPLARVRYELVDADVRRRRAVLQARTSYRVQGIAGTYGATRRIVAVRRGDGWRVLREGTTRDRPPWEIERYTVLRLDHFTVLVPAGATVGPLPDVLEQAYASIRERVVRPRPRRRYLVVVARDGTAARRLTSFIRGTESLAAITDAKVRDDGPAKQVAEVVSLRLLVVLSALAPLDYAEQQRVVTHELAHAVLTRRTSGRTPSWLNEGIAMYLSDDRRVGLAAELVTAQGTRAQRRALTLTALSGQDSIARLSGAGQSAAYAYASSAAHYIAARFGEKRLLRLYESFNDPKLPGDGGPTTTDAATRRVLHRPLAVLERDLRRWVITRALVEPLAP